ncbi:PTS mannose/fructose/sorbose/N-acetylgalactosamine transporter subunit IIC [Anaerorhabdus sp.]|uniref:PTS mannose/fructose/sorbose/N-acetylgalactosamine transporter subunit IIC n=1 Tax=Anaerorhabdus sp. TaxID=1872524 RepID=UPI002FC5A0D4
MFLIQCILVSILAGLLRWDGRVFGQTLAEVPLCAGVLVGIIMGDPYTGLIMGASLQLIFLGIVGIGGATPPDSTIGAVMGTFFAITAGLDAETVIALAMPMAILGQALGILCRMINVRYNIVIDKAAAEGNAKRIDSALWQGAFIFFILTAIPVFLGCYFGADVVQAIVDFIPPIILTGLSRSASLLPALGMALLMNFMFDKQTAVYLFLGFVLNAFLGMSLLGITFLGVIIAVAMYQAGKHKA